MRKISMEKEEWNREPDVDALEHAAKLSFSDAVAEFERLVARGSTLSMANLAHRYEYRPDNLGGPDFHSAEIWYRRSIDAGSAIATLPAGYFYLRRRNYVGAQEMFMIGAERGYAPSMVRLAHLYINGLGVEKDEIKADALLFTAAKLGNLWAKISRAERYMSADRSFLKVVKGVCLFLVVIIPFRFEIKFRSESEKLKK